jgi:WD40 repeat protein
MDNEIKIEALKRNPLADLSFIKREGTSTAAVSETFNKIVEQFSHAPHIRPGNNLSLFPNVQEEEDFDFSSALYFEKNLDYLKPTKLRASNFIGQSVFAKKPRKNNTTQDMLDEDLQEYEMAMEQGQFNLGQIMNSGRLMRLKLDMEKFPDRALTLEDFITVIRHIVFGYLDIDDEIFIRNLIDGFHRIDVHNSGKITFDMISSYIIEQEIMAEMAKEKALLYHPSSVVDESRHDNYIDKLFYYAPIDKLASMEQNMKYLKVYNAETLKLERTVVCRGGIALCSTYIRDYHIIVMTSSDKTMAFYDGSNFKFLKRLITPDSQHCLLWSISHQTLFSAGFEGKIYGWKLNVIFDPERKEEEVNYQTVLERGMPWKEEDSINDMVELGPIQQIATASNDRKIRIWDIRFDVANEPRKVLHGHSKAVRSIAYSSTHNLLVRNM